MELVQKQVRYMQEKPSITDQFQMDEDYNVPDTKDDVKQIVRSKETVKIEDINLIENYLRREYFRHLTFLNQVHVEMTYCFLKKKRKLYIL